MTLRPLLLALLLPVAACDRASAPADDTDPPALDSDPIADTGDSDPGDTDPGDTDPPPDTDLPPDTDPVDDSTTPVPLAGFGVVAGDCGVLDAAAWGSADPFFFDLGVDFGATPFDPSLLSPGAQQILDEGTLGGGSVESEAVSFDLLYRCELADLLKSETQIDYQDAGGKKTDILVEIDGRKVGVSVTRAMTYVHPEPCAPVNTTNLTDLLTRKVGDLPLSQANAQPWDAWERSVLYVVACDADHAAAAESIFWALPPATRGDAILIVAASDGDDAFIY